MAFFKISSTCVLLISLPLLCMCQNTDETQTEAKENERTQINLNSASGQFILFMGAIVLIDIFLSVFAFGFLNQQSSKKYKRQGFRSPYHAHGINQPPNPFRRKPSALAITLRKKIQQALRPKRPLYRQYGKRSVESEIEREDVFRPTFDYEFDDSQVQRSIDLVDTTFGVMNVESEPCRMRTICEMEKVASQNPIVSFFVRTVGPFVKGLEKYDDAAEKGRNGEDCALYYDECQASSLNKLPKFFQ